MGKLLVEHLEAAITNSGHFKWSEKFFHFRIFIYLFELHITLIRVKTLVFTLTSVFTLTLTKIITNLISVRTSRYINSNWYML